MNALLTAAKGSLLSAAKSPRYCPPLDKDTSGVLLAAKTDSSHIILSRQFKEHSTKRIYEAVVRGNLREDRGYVEAPIGGIPPIEKDGGN